MVIYRANNLKMALLRELGVMRVGRAVKFWSRHQVKKVVECFILSTKLSISKGWGVCPLPDNFGLCLPSLCFSSLSNRLYVYHTCIWTYLPTGLFCLVLLISHVQSVH